MRTGKGGTYWDVHKTGRVRAEEVQRGHVNVKDHGGHVDDLLDAARLAAGDPRRQREELQALRADNAAQGAGHNNDLLAGIKQGLCHLANRLHIIADPGSRLTKAPANGRELDGHNSDTLALCKVAEVLE